MFETEQLRLITPEVVGGNAVISLKHFDNFTEDASTDISSIEVNLKCVEEGVCDDFEPSPGDLDPNGEGLPIATNCTIDFFHGCCTTGKCSMVDCQRIQSLVIGRSRDDVPGLLICRALDSLIHCSILISFFASLSNFGFWEFRAPLYLPP